MPEQFLKNIEPVKSIIDMYHMSSSDASKKFDDNSLQFVFIDAEHTYSGAMSDIKLWLPKIKSNGFIGGDDIGRHGVLKAVEETFDTYRVIGNYWVVEPSIKMI